MGRLHIADKQVDWVSVTREYLDELYATIAEQKETIWQLTKSSNSLPTKSTNG
jgi:hypothetical protein